MPSDVMNVGRRFDGPALSPRVAALREAALLRYKHVGFSVPTLPQIDAASWRSRESGEDWLTWRARRVANRLRQMPIELSPGELVVGRPVLRTPTPEEQAANERAQDALSEIPPFPASDNGHFNPDYEKLFRLGVAGMLAEIRGYREAAESDEKRTFYDACETSMAAFSDFVVRVAEECKRSPDHVELAPMCRRVAMNPPGTFHEALQLMYLAIVALQSAEDHIITIPGRLDQTLWPFYRDDIANGQITREEALELIECFYIQLNLSLAPSLATSVVVGGRDARGNDLTNDLSYICLEARLATHLAYPTVGIAWHEGTPSELTDLGCEMIATGIGDPAFFNDEVIARGLRRHGVAYEDSLNWMNSSCVEIKVVGASNIWVTCPYFNLAKLLLDTMDAVADGAMPVPGSFDEFSRLVKDRVAEEVRTAAERMDERWRQRETAGCYPLASCFICDCLERGLDFDRGGARYNWVENSFVGLANLVDGLVAIGKLVYERGELTVGEFRDILSADFAGHEDLRLRIVNGMSSYGCDSDEADALATEWAGFIQTTSESYTVGGHSFVPGLFCWIMHGEFGSQTGATPDGRRAGTALADGAGAAQGRETAGPTASVLSTTKWDHERVIGGLVHNLKLSDKMLDSPAGVQALRSLIETYMRRGGFEIQVNVVGAETLRKAQAHPEDYADLVVRVAGYSDYFANLTPVMQEEVIARTEHGW